MADKFVTVTKSHGGRLWVPGGQHAVAEIIRRKLTNAAGGLTSTAAWGYWVDPQTGDTVGEPVYVYEYFFDGFDFQQRTLVNEAITTSLQLLLDAGEKEVLLETYGDGGVTRRIVRAP